MTGRATAVALGVLMLVSPTASFAQATPDPDSPAGEEYALPLDQARRQAAEGTERPAGKKRGNGASTKGSDREAAPLFGAGVSRGGSSGSADGSGGSADASGGSRKRSSSRAAEDSAAQPEPSEEKAAERTAGLAEDGGGGNTTLIGIVAAILLVGAGAGLGLRRFLGTPRS